MTTIVDYGAGNLRSVQNTLDELGAALRDHQLSPPMSKRRKR